MLGRLLSGGGVRVVVTVVQKTVVGDGLENKWHVVTDGEVVLEIPADQRVQQVGRRCLYDCSHFCPLWYYVDRRVLFVCSACARKENVLQARQSGKKRERGKCR